LKADRSDWSTVYNRAAAKLSREVVVPGAPTGIVGNNGGAGSPNVLYFAAGPDDETNGYFGKIEFAP
jgi:hypothetical protein